MNFLAPAFCALQSADSRLCRNRTRISMVSLLCRIAAVASPCLMSITAHAATPMLSAGGSNSFYLSSDGSIWGTGSMAAYPSGATSPVRLSDVPNVIEIATGYGGIYALQAEGTLWTVQYGSAAQAIQGVSQVKAISAFASHVFALKDDGTVWAWGFNEWGQLGNSLNQALIVSMRLNDTNAITSVWKWDCKTFGWQFYTPLMSSTELQTYAARKGYAVLTTINPGEGYWVNTKSQPRLAAQSCDSFILTGMNLAKGWNLVATGNGITPTEFNTNLKASAVPASLTTLWAWDNPKSAWYFYAPSLEAQGATALSGYIAGKGYLDFAAANKKLGKGTGFWVNR